jgi:hypothetical protein
LRSGLLSKVAPTSGHGATRKNRLTAVGRRRLRTGKQRWAVGNSRGA